MVIMKPFLRSFLFALFIMLMVFLSLLVMPDLKTMGLKLPKPLVSSPEDCQKLEGSLVFECITKFAVARGDEGLCERIRNDFYRDRCYLELHPGTADQMICEKLALTDARGECFARAALAAGSPELCLAAERGNAKPTETCLLRYAISSGKREVCLRIATAENAGDCLYRFASITKNPSDCSSSSDEATDVCLLALATDLGDQGVCFSLEGKRDECLFQVSVKLKNPEICNAIYDQSLREECKKAGK